jgi:hypothetical protein
MAVEKELLAPPLSNRYALVGVAFDYLMRFYLERLNPGAITKQWVAELALLSLSLWEEPPAVLVDGSGRVRVLLEPIEDLDIPKPKPKDAETVEKICWMIEQAKADHARYLDSGQITDSLIESALRLAQLDFIFRPGYIDEKLGYVHREDVDDLRRLISLVEPQLFKTSRLCILNPTFGEGSRLVGGADADLVIDDALIDIKTTKYLKLTRDHFHQLIGYFVLHTIDGVDGPTRKPKVSKVGIYFSRHAYLYTLDLSDVIHPETFPAFVDWFITRAKQEYAA